MAGEISAFIAITDRDWFECLSSAGELDEVNFWQPSPRVAFSALRPGEPLLFKLHSPTTRRNRAIKAKSTLSNSLTQSREITSRNLWKRTELTLLGDANGRANGSVFRFQRDRSTTGA